MILSIRHEDEGTFFCSAENPAGIASANFTVKVIDDGDSLILSAQDTNQFGASHHLDHNGNNSLDTEEEDSNMFKVSKVNYRNVKCV